MNLRVGEAAMGLLVVGCQPELELPPIIESSDHLVLRSHEPVCAGTFAEMEARVIAVQGLFEAPPVQVTYNWVGERTPEVECVPGASACSYGHDIFALYLANEHELVHAARSNLLPGALEEGVATFLGTVDGVDPAGTRESLRLAMESDETDFSYTRAAEFVQFLVQLHGIEPLIELAEYTEYSTKFVDWRPKFEGIYGQSWDAIWTAYMVSPECPAGVMTDDVFLCYGDTPPSIDLTPPTFSGSAEYMQSMDCASEAIVGPISGDRFRHEIAVEFVDPIVSTLWVRLQGDIASGSQLGLRYCGPCAEVETGIVVTDAEVVQPITAQPGRYVLELIQPASAGGQLGVEVSY